MRQHIVLVAAFVVLAASLSPLAGAHADVTVHGRYQLTLGWVVEPPVLDAENGVYLAVTDLGAPAGGHGHAHGDGGHGHGDAGHGHGDVDVNAHGALFESGDLEKGQNFTYTVPHSLEGKKIPFHDHFDHASTGEITVSATAPDHDTLDVEVRDDGFHPANVSVRPDAVIRWTNNKTAAGDASPFAKVVSGLLGDGHAHGTPVESAEKTLNITVSTGGKDRTFALTPIKDKPGQYQARFIPTVPGVYAVRVHGTLGGMAVDVTKEIERVEPSKFDKWPETGPGTFEAKEDIAEKDEQLGKKDAEIAQLKAQLEEERATPGAGLLAVLAALGVVAIVARRRR